MAYTNTYSNHTDDTLKKFPLALTWNASLWEGGQPKPQAKGSILAEMRQHAKAIEAQFNVIGTDPSYSDVDDTNLQAGDKINASLMNAGNGLLSGINQFDKEPDVDAPAASDEITASKIVSIREKLEGESAYANYSNSNNSGYGRYSLNSYANTYSNYYGQTTKTALYVKQGYSRCVHIDGWYYRYSRNSYLNHYNYNQSIAEYQRTCLGDTFIGSGYNNKGYTQGSGYSVYNRYSNYNRNDTPAAVYTNTNLPNPGTYQNDL